MAPRNAAPAGHYRPGRGSAWLLGALVLLLVVTVLSLGLGAVRLSPGEVWSGLVSSSDPLARITVRQIRLPRVLDAMLVGACLSVAGALLQGVTRNSLADPTILGTTSAAGLATAIALVISPTIGTSALTAVSVSGGVAGALILFVLAWRQSVSPTRLALSGVALSAFFGAAIVGLLSSSRTFIQTSVNFLAGGLNLRDWDDLYAAGPYAAVALVAAMLCSGRLNALALGDDVAAGLGVLTDRTRLLVLAIAGVLVGAAVSIAGLVSFVGLVCPHLARLTVGGDFRLRLPASALYGALLVASADLFARMVIAPSEIPFGIVTAGIGAPFLLYLVRVRG